MTTEEPPKLLFTTARVSATELDAGRRRKPSLELIASDDGQQTTIIRRTGNRGRHLHVVDRPLDEIITDLSGVDNAKPLSPEEIAKRFVNTAKKIT